MSVRRVPPCAGLREPHLDFHREWVCSGERMAPWVVSRHPADFAAMLAFLRAGPAASGPEVPHSTHWLVTEDGDRVLGVSNLRHRRNDRLRRMGGHIGYGSERRREYARVLLRLTLHEARAVGLDVLPCCDPDNVASQRTIRGCGGVRDRDGAAGAPVLDRPPCGRQAAPRTARRRQ